MKNVFQFAALIAVTGTALMAASSPTFAAPHLARTGSHKIAAVKHKKVLINFERAKTRKIRKIVKKNQS